MRLAFVVSHPIQYYTPIYQRLAMREDLIIKVFYTWHAGQAAVADPGFQRRIMWDIPVNEGYEHELVPNVAANPGTHHFWGLRNPSLVHRVLAFKPDIVHVTGWAWASHLRALHAFKRNGIKTAFRGDSHFLDEAPVYRKLAKRAVLSRIYAWPNAFLVTGTANRRYYEASGVGDERLFSCPHSIDVARFAEPNDLYEAEARTWRETLGIGPDKLAVLFAGKFEPKKNPLGLIETIIARNDPNVVLLMAGAGPLEKQVMDMALCAPKRVKVLPFQNQRRMPVVYRLGDLFVLPSIYGETWGLAMNEALASNRPVLVSDRVGGAVDVVTSECGRIFNAKDDRALLIALDEMLANVEKLKSMSKKARVRAKFFDIEVTVNSMLTCFDQMMLQ